MIAIKSILCPVDFSVLSRHALQHGVQLARWFESDLTLLYVNPPPVAPPAMPYGGLPGPIPMESLPPLPVSPERTHHELTAELTKFAASVGTTGVALSIHVRSGYPAKEVLDEAAAQENDLIVMGTHGHTGFDRLMLGSVTEKVLRKATCPVFTVPPPVGAPTGDALQMLKRILCPMDFSDSSLKSLEYALSLAREADAELLLLHVIEGLADLKHWPQPINPSILEYLRLSEERALARLREIVPQEARTWCRPKEILLTGKPYEAILRVAQEEDAHLIVMGVHGRNPVNLMFFGSTTNHVVRASSCPVLTLKG
jgi:nucleotide-binding universal stress UspA family protein